MNIENQVIEHTSQPDDHTVFIADHMIADFSSELAGWAVTSAQNVDTDIEAIMFVCGRVQSGMQCQEYLVNACKAVVSEGYCHMYDNGVYPANVIVAHCVGSAMAINGMYDIAYKYALQAAQRMLLKGYKSIDEFFKAQQIDFNKAVKA